MLNRDHVQERLSGCVVDPNGSPSISYKVGQRGILIGSLKRTMDGRLQVNVSADLSGISRIARSHMCDGVYKGEIDVSGDKDKKKSHT